LPRFASWGATLKRYGRLTVAKLIYTTIMSLDGYVADKDGNFDWAAPDEEVHDFVNDLERRVGSYLYGRRMYEVMRYWETAHASPTCHPSSRTTPRYGGRQGRVLQDA
jgi:dihydrofolate reductase